MNFNLMLAVMLIVAAPTIAQAQQFEPGGHPIKPTLQEAQRLVQTITADREKVQVYCEIGKLQDEMDKAEEKNDTQKLRTLGAKMDRLEQQLGLEYVRVMGGLEEVDP